MSYIRPDENCHEYCIYGKACKELFHVTGSNGIDPFECGTFCKLHDLAMEARYIALEQARERGEID
jgi:hypothetical protein